MARYLRHTLTGDITTVLEDDDATYVGLLAQRQGGQPNRPLYQAVELTDSAVTPHSGPGGGGGGGVPVADETGIVVDSTTYDNTISGVGKLKTLVFPSDTGALAIALAGDAFPRWLFASDAADGFFMGDGTFDPYYLGAYTSLEWTSEGMLVQGPNGLRVQNGAATAAGVPQLAQISPRFSTLSGSLQTVALVTNVGSQVDLTRDVEVHSIFQSDLAEAAQVVVQLSPDNVTYSTLEMLTIPAGQVFDSVSVRVPAGWYLKATLTGGAPTIVESVYY